MASWNVYNCGFSTLFRMKSHIMRVVDGSSLAAAIFVLIAPVLHAQDQTEASRTIQGGGITAPGWAGKIDANEERAGQALQNAKFAQEGNVLHITTGPAVTYWNPANKATGDYTVKARFNEPKYMNLNSHPHPCTALSSLAMIWEPSSKVTSTARLTAMGTSSCADSARTPSRTYVAGENLDRNCIHCGRTVTL